MPPGSSIKVEKELSIPKSNAAKPKISEFWPKISEAKKGKSFANKTNIAHSPTTDPIIAKISQIEKQKRTNL